MPTWFIDIKMPLVQQRYEMADITDSTNGIFFTEDSLGFQIVLEGSMDPTVLPDLPVIPINLDISIAAPDPELDGIDLSLGVPPINIPISILIAPNPNLSDDLQLQLPDTADITIDTTVYLGFPGDPILDDYGNLQMIDTTLILSNWTPFGFPTESVRHTSGKYYNQIVVAAFNQILALIGDSLNQVISLGLDTLDVSSMAPFLASIDTLIISSSDSNYYLTSFKNSMPTSLTNVYSYMVTGNADPLTDTLANHSNMPTVAPGTTYEESTSLSGKGLTNYLNLNTNFALGSAPELESEGDTIVTIPPGSLYVDFTIKFRIEDFDSLDVTTSYYSLTDQVDIDTMSFDVDMEDQGISKMELFQAILDSSDDVGFRQNKLSITNLESSLPFDMEFLMDFKNFYPREVRIDTVLRKGEKHNYIFLLGGDTLRASDPDTPLSQLELDLDIALPAQQATLPLDGSSLGNFTMDMKMEALKFSSLEAYMFMEMPSSPTQQELPGGLTGAIPYLANFEIIMKSQIRLPILMNMDFTATNSLGEVMTLPVVVDTIGFPSSGLPEDTSMTIIGLSREGTKITIYETLDDSLPSYEKLTGCDTCATIIDILGFNPVTLDIIPTVRVDGRGTIEGGKSIQGGFKVTMPLALILEPMTFPGGTPTVLEEMDHNTRNKIRSSLIHSEMVFDITNNFPFASKLAVLLSNLESFPIDTTLEALSTFTHELDSLGLSTADSVYIIRNCSELSPDGGNIYIFNVMTDFSECIDGMPYLIGYNESGLDTAISYVDTLFKFILPDPSQLYTDDSTNQDDFFVYSDSLPAGMIAEPGYANYASPMTTERIRLITDPGNHYVMPWFHLNGTNGEGIFLSIQDYLEVGSFITFRVSSTGMFAPANPELVITWPNGSEILYTDQTYTIKWQTYGDIGNINLDYSIDPDSTISAENDWHWGGDDGGIIAEDISNMGTFDWDISGLPVTDSLRIRITSVDKVVLNLETDKMQIARDMNGWYLKVRNPSTVTSTTANPIFINPYSRKWHRE